MTCYWHKQANEYHSWDQQISIFKKKDLVYELELKHKNLGSLKIEGKNLSLVKPGDPQGRLIDFTRFWQKK